MCAEALMMACDERLGAQSPAALMVCDTFLARDAWDTMMHREFTAPRDGSMWVRDIGTRADIERDQVRAHLAGGWRHIRPCPDIATDWTRVEALRGVSVSAIAEGSVAALSVSGGLHVSGHACCGLPWPMPGPSAMSRAHQFGRAPFGVGVKVVAAGGRHMLAILATDELVEWGEDPTADSFVVHTDRVRRYVTATRRPRCGMWSRPLPTQHRVCSIACGRHHSIAVTTDGAVYTWGAWGLPGMLGHGNDTSAATTAASAAPRRVLRLEGEHATLAVASRAANHSAVITSDGKLFMWGSGLHGQIGVSVASVGTGVPVWTLREHRVASAAVGPTFTVILCTDRRVFSCGCVGDDPHRMDGCLLPGASTTLIPPWRLRHVAALDGKLVTQVAAGEHTAYAVLRSGDVFMWGRVPVGLAVVPEYQQSLVVETHSDGAHTMAPAPVKLVMPGRVASISPSTTRIGIIVDESV